MVDIVAVSADSAAHRHTSITGQETHPAHLEAQLFPTKNGRVAERDSDFKKATVVEAWESVANAAAGMSERRNIQRKPQNDTCIVRWLKARCTSLLSSWWRINWPVEP